jgi:hypothetical protein
MTQRRLFVAACVASAGILAVGCFLLIIWGGSPPAWVLTAELATFCAIALAYGFSASLPSLGPWLSSRPIQGAACICLGVGAVFVPLEFVVAAILIAVGTRRLWSAACELEETQTQRVTVINTTGRDLIASWKEGELASKEV